MQKDFLNYKFLFMSSKEQDMVENIFIRMLNDKVYWKGII